MHAFLIRFLPILLVAVAVGPTAAANEPAGNESDSIQAALDRLRTVVETVEASDEEPGLASVMILRYASQAVLVELLAAHEEPERSQMTEAQKREARNLLNRGSSLVLVPMVHQLENSFDELQARPGPFTRDELKTLAPSIRKLGQRIDEITAQIDPEVARKPDGLARAQALLRRYSIFDLELAANELIAEAENLETRSPAPSAQELQAVQEQTRTLEARLERELTQESTEEPRLPEKTEAQVRAAVSRARTLALIPFVERLLPFLAEMESRETALSAAELDLVEERADELVEEIEKVRPGTLDEYDSEAPPVVARARSVLRRLVSLELQPSIPAGLEMLAELEQSQESLTDEELEPFRASVGELRSLLVGFETRPAAKSEEVEPDLVQQARELLWRFALIDLTVSVSGMEPIVASLEKEKKRPTAEELTEVNRLAEEMQPKLREARGKDESQVPESERSEGSPGVVVQARDLMRRVAALQPQSLAAAEEGRDAPVTQPFLRKFRFYGSLRLRTFLSPNGFSIVDDETSRIGVRANTKIVKDHELYGRFEVGVHAIEFFEGIPDKGRDENPAGKLFPIRLAYLGVEAPWGNAAIGKLWSAYWNVAVFSDQLPAYTGLTTGTFNNGDGSVSGTGRTDNTIQYRGARAGFNYSAQMQLRNLTENSSRLADTIGGSVTFERKDGIELGGAFSTVRDGVSDPESDQPKRGDRAFIVGARTKNEQRYLGATLAYTRNHYRDDLDRFFDGVGFELYSDYLVLKKLRLRFVADGLFPVSGPPGEYRLLYFVAGASYDILSKLRVFVLPRLSFSKNSDGSRRGDHTVAVLLLFNF